MNQKVMSQWKKTMETHFSFKNGEKWVFVFSNFSFLLKTFLRPHLSNKYALIFVILKAPTSPKINH